MTDQVIPRLTLRQRWHRLRTSPRFPWLILAGVAIVGMLSQVYCYYWSLRTEEMLVRTNGYSERIAIYPHWIRKHLGHGFVRHLEPIHAVRLRTLYPKSPEIRSDDLRWLRGMPLLEELNIGESLSSEDLWYLKCLRGLRTVRLYHASSEAIDALAWLPSLNHLHVSFQKTITPSTLQRVASLPRLERLSCNFDKNIQSHPDVVLACHALKHARGLRRLDLPLSDRNQFRALTSPLPDGSPTFPELLELRIAGTREVSPEDLDHLKNLPNLIHLDLSYSSITDAHLPHLRQLPLLRTLYLEANPNITDEGARVLASMSKLESLNIKRTRITTTGQQTLARLSRLRCLRADMGSDARNALRKMLPPGCELDNN